MESYEVLFLLLKLNWLLFVVAAGCCIGSLTNVIVYRMPRGMSIVTPPSRCPKCGTRLTFRENIPVLGWLILRGKCKYCKSPISPEYPIVEASVGLLFGVFFAFWYMIPSGAVWLGIDWGQFRPEWANNDWAYVWPTFIVILSLLGSLVAMTLVDAKTSTIPLALCWFPTIVALIAHPAHAAWIQHTIGGLRKTAPGAVWAIPTPGPNGWPWVGAMLGATAGVVLANVLVATGLIRRSFADYDEWERSLNAATPEPQPPAGEMPACAAGLDQAASELHQTQEVVPDPAPIQTADASPEGPVPDQGGATTDQVDKLPTSPEETWIQYPHARREMFKELAFLAPIAGLGMLGWYAANWVGIGADGGIPLWLRVLTGVLMGYFIGGGVVWAVRILGSLGFGKEAMGLGDVHLMAAVGACVGWIDATLAFFGAAFVGLLWFTMGWLFSGVFKRAMPYGPFLATATVLVLFFKPGVEAALSRLLHQTINLP